MRGDSDHVSNYMPWWLGDYRRDTGDLDCLEHGAYLQLLGELWTAGGYLPFEPDRLCRRISLDPGRWNGVWATISRFFDVLDGRISQRRLLYELGQASLLRARRSAAGRAGADARYGNRIAKASANGKHQPLSPSPSPSESSARPDRTDGREDSSVSGVAAGTPPAPAAPALLVFPTVRGKKNGPTKWHYTAELETELREYFPGLDVRAAVRAGLAWVKAKNANRKTADGMRRFVTGWLNRAQNRGEHRLPSGSPSESRRAPAGGGLEDYCDWHKDARNDGKPSRRPKESCPSCKHLTARERVRSSDGPMPIGALEDELPVWAGGNGVAR